MLHIVREHGPPPLQETSACVTHIIEYQDMLRKFPRSWCLHPDQQGSTGKHSGQVLPTKYVSTWVQRKHMCSQLQVRTSWPPGAGVDIEWLRSWCPDMNCRLGDYEDSMRLDVLEMKAGCPYHELSMWLCLVGPVMRMDADVKQFLKDPLNLDTCVNIIREHQARTGIPPTLELLGQSIWRRMVREVAAGARAAKATGSGAAPEPGRKRPAAAQTTAGATAEAQKSEKQQGGQVKRRKARKGKEGKKEEVEKEKEREAEEAGEKVEEKKEEEEKEKEEEREEEEEAGVEQRKAERAATKAAAPKPKRKAWRGLVVGDPEPAARLPFFDEADVSDSQRVPNLGEIAAQGDAKRIKMTPADRCRDREESAAEDAEEDERTEAEEEEEEEAQESEETGQQDAEEEEEEEAEEKEMEKVGKQMRRTQAQQGMPKKKKPRTRTPEEGETLSEKKVEPGTVEKKPIRIRRRWPQKKREPKAGGRPSAPTPRAGLTDSGGHMIFAIPHSVDYHLDPHAWRRDPRLRSGDWAEKRGWRQCECNGTCGRKSCPGRQRGYKQQGYEKYRVGCPNPALSRTQVKPRCASCVCRGKWTPVRQGRWTPNAEARASPCEKHCNRTGFCHRHRGTTKPATTKQQSGMEQPAAIMKRPAAEMEQQAVVLRRPAADS